MVDCNKRRVAPTAAFLSAIFNPVIFCDLGMHGSPEDHEEYGPLKWVCISYYSVLLILT